MLLVEQILKWAVAVSKNDLLVKHLHMKACIKGWVTCLMKHSLQSQRGVMRRINILCSNQRSGGSIKSKKICLSSWSIKEADYCSTTGDICATAGIQSNITLEQAPPSDILPFQPWQSKDVIDVSAPPPSCLNLGEKKHTLPVLYSTGQSWEFSVDIWSNLTRDYKQLMELMSWKPTPQ